MMSCLWCVVVCYVQCCIATSVLDADAVDEFYRNGYHIARGLMAPEVKELKAEMVRLMNEASEEESSAWDGNGASKYSVSYQPDALTGEPIAGRIFKIQGIAMRSEVTRSLVLQSPKLVSIASQLLRVADSEAMDAFGTKFFPLLPVYNGSTKSTSTSWHDDTHFFGTASDRVLSMSLYLEDTDVETGCLRVVPGSHASYGDGQERELRYSAGLAEASHGEWLELLPIGETPMDVIVPAGTPVLFDGRLIHGARHNVSPERSSFRIVAHFVPAALSMSWRGVDFGREYADRWEVRAPITTAMRSDL